MKKQIAILIMALLIIAPAIHDVSAAKTVFITSDNIVDHDADLRVLNSIKSYIEEISGGELQVIVDNEAPAAGEGWRAIAVTSDVSICLAASDAGNESLAGMHDPGTFLKNAGVYYIQPTKEFPQNTDDGIMDRYDEGMNRQIAQEIVDIVNSHGGDSKVLSDSLVTHNIVKPAVMAQASKALVESGDKEMQGTYGNYTAAQLLYQTSSYLNGNGLDVPKSYDPPSDPLGISFFTKDTYSVYDYFNMAGIVREYMDQNGKAPDSIEYEGAHISYYDLLYNFAKITQNHTDAEHMGFESEYHFDKVNDSILLHIFPFVVILFVLLIAYRFFKRIRRF